MADSKLLYPRQGYDCLRCAKPCGGWRILVEPAAVAFLADHPRAQQARLAGYVPLHLHEDGWAHLGFDEGGKCLFLGPDRLCEVHRSHGFSRKPRACQQFPFFLVHTPEGLQVGLSFCCTAVQADHGRPIEQHQAELVLLATTGAYPKVGFEPLAFTSDTSLTWEEYRRWEAQLLSQVQGAAEAFQLERLLWEALSAGVPREPLLSSFGAAAMGYLESSDLETMEWVRQRWLAGESYLSPRFRVGVTPARVDLDALPQAPLRRYVGHLIERKFLALGPTIAGRLAGLAVLPRLLAGYGKVLQAALSASPEQAFWCALDIVEGELFSHVEGVEGFFAEFGRQLTAPA